jgi:hypothetical protein
MGKSIKDAALEYIEQGLSVIPISPGSKKPCCSWSEFQRRLPMEEEVEAWFENWPKAQLALVTGSVSGVAAIDLDNQEAVSWARQNLPRTGIFQRTNKGWHLFYRMNGEPIQNGVRIVEGVDVRGDGGYVLIDPSQHPDGGRYELKVKPSFDWDNLPYFPKECLPKQNGTEEREPVTLDPAPEGERNDRLARLAGRYFAKGLEYPEVLTFCKGWNADLEKPLSKEEVERTVHSIYKRDHQNGLSISKQGKASISDSKPNQSGEKALDTGSLSQMIEDWIRNNEGKFQVNQIDSEFNLKTRQEKNNRSYILNRLSKQGLIRKEGQRTGEWRIVSKDCEAMDIFGSGVEKIKIPLPLGVSEMVNIYPGSIVVIAGSSNSGKSSMALNFIHACFAYLSTLRERYNIYSIPACLSRTRKTPSNFSEYLAEYMAPQSQEAEVHYFNSEMAAPEMRDRLEAFPGGAEDFRKVNFWKRSGDFADAIRPNGINVIDYMEAYDEFWKVGQWINEIHKELNRGIAVIVLQKKKGNEIGRGGELTIEKPRLYLSLESNPPHGGICKIVKAKSFADTNNNPNGKEIDFKLVNGADFIPISGWRHVKDEKEREKINKQYKRQANGEQSYAFEFRADNDEIVGLNFRDLDSFKAQYQNIDVEHELIKLVDFTRRSDWLNRRNWFHQVKGWLKKRDNENAQEEEHE